MGALFQASSSSTPRTGTTSATRPRPSSGLWCASTSRGGWRARRRWSTSGRWLARGSKTYAGLYFLMMHVGWTWARLRDLSLALSLGKSSPSPDFVLAWHLGLGHKPECLYLLLWCGHSALVHILFEVKSTSSQWTRSLGPCWLLCSYFGAITPGKADLNTVHVLF